MRDPTCREITELVTDYLEGAMPDEVRNRFERHLVFCDWCVTYLQQMRQAIALTGGLRDEDLAPEAMDRLVSAFRGWQR